MLIVMPFLPFLGGHVVYLLFTETDRTHTKIAYCVAFPATCMFGISQASGGA